ncbi:MAG TPA: hypothetical protein VFH42_04310, partial [Sporolactobacillaceae bacterium]|nr:hypothetical protein [Sporolactobacillaceae bacterium]
SIGTVVLSILPLVLGLLIHKEVHASSESYLTSVSKGEIPFPSLNWLDVLTLIMLPVLFVDVIFGKRSIITRLTLLLTGFLGIILFLIYYAGGHVSGSILVSSRSLDLWALTVPLILGMSTFVIGQWGWAGLTWLIKTRSLFRVSRIVTTTFLIFTLILGFHPKAIQAYKMERDNSVEQYLKIKNQNTAHNWMIVSNNEGYAVVLGNGVHMYLATFIKRYDPAKPSLTTYGTNGLDRNVPNEVYVFNEKKVYEVPKTLGFYSILKPEYEERIQSNQAFENWLNVYKAHSNKVDIYYQSKTLTVYHFHIPKKKRKAMVPFWDK